jgi:hypothetical protein
MIKELIKLAKDLDEAGQTSVADNVDKVLKSFEKKFETDSQKICAQIAAKVNEMKMINGRARRGSTGFGVGSSAIIIGYSGSIDGKPGNAGDTTARSKAAVDAAIKALGLSGKVVATEAEQDKITGYGSVVDSDPPPSYARPASYQVDIVYLEISE